MKRIPVILFLLLCGAVLESEKPGFLDSKHSLYLNIKDFGAKGDGKSDDTPALLAAIEEAERSEGTIYFPTGEYKIHPVKLPSHITLMGNSAWAYANKDGKDDQFEGRTILSALSGGARALLDLGSSRGTRILGLTLDGKRLGTNMHGVYARHAGCDRPSSRGESGSAEAWSEAGTRARVHLNLLYQIPRALLTRVGLLSH